MVNELLVFEVLRFDCIFTDNPEPKPHDINPSSPAEQNDWGDYK